MAMALAQLNAKKPGGNSETGESKVRPLGFTSQKNCALDQFVCNVGACATQPIQRRFGSRNESALLRENDYT